MIHVKPLHVRQLMQSLALFFYLSLTGCDTLSSLTKTASLENIPVCEIAPAGTARAYVNSMFGWLGVSFRLTDASAKVICALPAAK
jgi:hypothetical protein